MTLEKIKDIESEIARTQRNKATESHLAILKAKLSKLRRALLQPTASKNHIDTGFDISKSGVARVGFIGFPSVGKSTLMNRLTNVKSEVAAYEFTTLTAMPGELKLNNARIQILDLPGIIEGAKSGKGRGKQVLGMARSCNLVLIVLDSTKPLQHKKIIDNELYGFGMRLNKQKPNIKITKKDRGGGGLSIINHTKTPTEIFQRVCEEYRVNSSEVKINEGDVDDLIDAIEGNRIYVPSFYVLNKVDGVTLPELNVLCRMKHVVPISSEKEWGLEYLKDQLWAYLDLVRIYPKPKGQPVDEPVVLKRGRTTVREFCAVIHKDLVKSFKYAIVWGESVKHCPQKVGKDHMLVDGDVIQIVKTY